MKTRLAQNRARACRKAGGTRALCCRPIICKPRNSFGRCWRCWTWRGQDKRKDGIDRAYLRKPYRIGEAERDIVRHRRKIQYVKRSRKSIEISRAPRHAIALPAGVAINSLSLQFQWNSTLNQMSRPPPANKSLPQENWNDTGCLTTSF
jgi:hypothetical protein